MTKQETTKKIRLPDKRSINLAEAGIKRIDLRIAIPAIILIIVAAALFSKFAVIDRLVAVSKAEAEVAELQRRVNDGYARMASFADINDLYAHYTYSYMTEEELERTDRVQIIDMLNRVVLPTAPIDSWSVTGNKMTVMMSGNTLEEINKIMQALMLEDIVDYCTINTATTKDKNDKSDNVSAQITIYLIKVSEEVKG